VPTPTPPPAPAPTPSTGTSEAAITIGVKVTSDWGTGRNVDLTVTNTGNTTINGWSVSMPWAGTSVSMWNATSTLSGGILSATNASWNGALAPGNSATVGLTDNGTFTAPLTCTSTAGSCEIAGAGSTATVTPSPEAVVPVVKPVPTTPYTPKSGSYTGAQKIIAYYPAWATYARNYQVADIPEQKITHINYAFANVQNGKCVLGDSYADIDKAFAGDSWDQGALRGNFNQLEKLKVANPKLRTMISLGGWTWSQNFPTAAATEQSRTEFVSSCVKFMKQYGFDGIDVDWEYPVSGGLFQGTAADKENYTQLLEKFRTVLNTEEIKDGQDYYLSIAAPAGPTIISNLEVGKLGGILDWMNLMSYDFHGSWDPITGHNAPMSVGPKDTASAFSITDAVNTYLNGGFPANKLVLGVAFYGRGWDNVASTAGGLYQSGAGASVGTWEKGVFDYTDIRNNYLPTMQRYWDADAQVPYLYDAVRKLWISYDDPQSIKIKADFIKAKGLGGAMVWEITGDRDEELLDTLVANL
jgi:chitinase